MGIQKNEHLSHHQPLFTVVADLSIVLHTWLRPDHTADRSELLTFIDEAVTPLPPRPPIDLVRADSGFCANAALTHSEVRYLTYFWGRCFLPGLRLLLSGLTAGTALDVPCRLTDLHSQSEGWPTLEDSWWSGN